MKKTFIIACLVLFVFINVNLIYAENSTDVLADDTANVDEKTFSDLKLEIDSAEDNATINLNEDYKFNSSSDADLIGGNVISKNLTIAGDNKSCIDGGNAARLLFIGSNCSVVLKDLTLKNGYSSNEGGAIFLCSNSTLTLINCVFLNNKVYNSNGGALFGQKETNIEINKCTFSNNTSIRESDLEWVQFKKGMGSAVCVSIGSIVNMYDSVFKSNNAYLSTILVVSYDDVDEDTSRLYVKRCLFENNTSFSCGVIYLDELGIGEIADSVFRNNLAESSGATLILDASYSAVVKNCLFDRNVGEKGGAIHIKVYDYSCRSNVSVMDCNFTGNFASVYGGAIFSKYGLAEISNCNFMDNRAGECGGAIFTKLSDLNLLDSSFDKNEAPYGGAIYIKDGNASIMNSKFSQSKADNNGGAIYVKSSKFILSDSVFDKSSASYGGAIFIRDSTASVMDSKFNNNEATNKGGAIFSKIQTITSNNCNYISNVAPKGSNVYGAFIAQITQTSRYFGDFIISIKLNSPWNMPLSQKVKLKFKSSKTYSTKWLKTDSNGFLKLKVPMILNAGKYSLEVEMVDGICYNNPTYINVYKAPAILKVKKLTTSYKSGKSYKIQVINTKTKRPVSFSKISLKIYTGKSHTVRTFKSDKNGLISFDASNLDAGKHAVKIYAGDKNIKLSKTNSQIKIKKAKAKVKSSKSIKKNSKLIISVKYASTGKPIKKAKFNVDISGKKLHKTLKLKTNSKGMLKLSTKKLSKGKYKINVLLKNKNYNIDKILAVKIK